MERDFRRRIVLAGIATSLGVLTALASDPAAAQTARFKEAPVLAEQVRAGKLPAVDARLPETPLLVPVVERVGDYGGVWRRAFLGPADSNNYVRVVYDALFRFSPDGAKIEPKIAAGAENNDPAGRSSRHVKNLAAEARRCTRWR